MRLYLIALQFLTIIPLPFDTRCQKGDLGRATALFPLAGLTIGALLWGINWLISPWLARPLTDALLITALAIVTGALHLDGLADVCDGLAARGSRERFLAIMKDSHVGAAGAVAVALGLLLKWQALVAVPLEYKSQALLLFPLLSRFSQTVAISGARHARSDGLGKLFIEEFHAVAPLVAAISSVALIFLILPRHGLLALTGVLLTTLAIRFYFQRRLGGITGDIIGCINELCEIVALLLISANIFPQP